MSELPTGWVEATIGEVTLPFVSVNPTKEPNAEFRYVDIGSIDKSNQTIGEHKLFAGSDAPSRARRVIHEGDVLFSTVRTYLKNIAAVPDHLDGALTSTGIAVLRASAAIDHRYLFNWVCSDEFVGKMSGAQDGTLYPAVTDKDVSTGKILLPPLPEQRRIVAKLEGLATRTARARADLSRIPTLIARYKQRLLALAFSGRVIGRATVGSDHMEGGCWDIPADWRWVRFDEVAEIASNLVPPASIPDLPHIAPDNIESRTARLLPYKTIGEDGVISAKSRFFPGQILYSKIRPYLRKAVLVDFDGACSADMYPINARASLNAKFLLYWLISDDFAQFSAMHEGRTVLPKINQKALNGTPFPLAPLNEQAEIVRRIESAFGRLDRMAADHAAAARLIPKLDAAILTKAFRGDLVPQDPNDEPSSLLLERIRAEREAAPKAKSSRGRSRFTVDDATLQTLDELKVATGPTRTDQVRAAIRKGTTMPKSRQDDDVMDQPYLAGKLKGLPRADVQTLFRAADLPVAEFYKQLAWEIGAGHIIDDPRELKAA